MKLLWNLNKMRVMKIICYLYTHKGHFYYKMVFLKNCIFLFFSSLTLNFLILDLLISHYPLFWIPIFCYYYAQWQDGIKSKMWKHYIVLKFSKLSLTKKNARWITFFLQLLIKPNLFHNLYIKFYFTKVITYLKWTQLLSWVNCKTCNFSQK